jgi:hypothetical protein
MGTEFPHYGPHNRSLEQKPAGEKQSRDWLAEDAVACEPFSAPIPC